MLPRTTKHSCFRISTQTVLQQVCELSIAHANVFASTFVLLRLPLAFWNSCSQTRLLSWTSACDCICYTTMHSLASFSIACLRKVNDLLMLMPAFREAPCVPAFSCLSLNAQTSQFYLTIEKLGLTFLPDPRGSLCSFSHSFVWVG